MSGRIQCTAEERLVLNLLLDRYERSKWFFEGFSKQRVLMRASDVPEISALEENADAWRALLDALKRLKQESVVDFSWVRFETGHLVDEIWLVTQVEAVSKAYSLAGRKPKADGLLELEHQICDALPEFRERSDLKCFLEECLETVRLRRRMPRFFSEDSVLNGDILKFLAVADAAGSQSDSDEGDMMERVVSTRLYGDSKYFERFVKGKVLSVLRYLDTEELSDDQLLLQRGVTRWPQIFEFAGAVDVVFDDGSIVSYAALRDGAYINSETLRRVISVRFGDLRRILFIENKANYVDYVLHRRQSDELVIYHGGVFSPAGGRWFSLLSEARRLYCPSAACFHWSDIDLGGFRIFVRLRNTYFPDLIPFLMDADTLRKNREMCMSISGNAYRQKLERLLQNPDYSVFYSAIQLMLQENIRLEQEALL